MSEYNFVKYVKPIIQRTSVRNTAPAVSGYVSNNPKLVFNIAAVKEFNLVGFKFCEVYYDTNKRALGFLFGNVAIAEDGKKNLRATFIRRSGVVVISASGLCKRFNIDLAKIKKRPIEVVGKMLVIVIPE